VSDYTPYVQQLLKSDSGHAPDVILCLLQADCIPMYTQLRAAGFKGEFAHSLYADIIAKPMEGSVANSVFASLSEASPARDQMKADVTAVKADQPLETGDVAAYFATDMFIQALKTAAKGGKAGITPENVQKAAATQTWKFGKLAGPTKYPESTVTPSPTCSAILKSDGKLFQTVIPYSCSDKQYKVPG
jgi:ABC-type branched-subunit amino acid transport system substrate-binding protein